MSQLLQSLEDGMNGPSIAPISRLVNSRDDLLINDPLL